MKKNGNEGPKTLKRSLRIHRPRILMIVKVSAIHSRYHALIGKGSEVFS